MPDEETFDVEPDGQPGDEFEGIEVLEAEDPYTSETAAYAAIEKPTPSEVGRARRAAANVVPDARVLYLVVVSPSMDPVEGFETLSHYFTSEAEPSRYNAPRLSIGWAGTPDEIEFVTDLIARAIINAAEARGSELDIVRARQLGKEALADDSDNDGAVSLVASQDGVPIGHLTAYPGWKDPLIEEKFTRVLDVYILEGHRGQGATRALMEHISRFAAARRERLIAEVSTDMHDAWRSVVRQIQNNDWRYHHTLIRSVVPLR